ncbi:MAG: glycosidase [Gemmatimonadales bacterium]
MTARPQSPSEVELFERHPDNPLLTAEHWPYPMNSVFNPGAVRLVQGGETLLLCRVEDRRGISHLTAARSADGVTGWRIDPAPTLLPDPEHYPEELWGIEDPRIVWVPELGRYAVTYTAYTRAGPGVALALTEDFRRFERVGLVAAPEDKDAALFPRRFGGRWAMIHRPVSGSYVGHIWLSFSPDLRHWGGYHLLLEARGGAWWDAGKIGLSPPPIETPEGWLIIYHGVRRTASGSIYRLGLALLDLEDPTRCLLRSDDWVFGPRAPYEMVGDVGDVVFVCGATVAADGDTLRLYYGAADTVIALATGSLARVLAWLKLNGRSGGPARDRRRT